MRLSHHHRSDPASLDRLGDLKYSARNVHCSDIEKKVRALTPFPISYDVLGGQGTGFTEYAYTEFLTGLWAFSQSVEINARLMVEVASDDTYGHNLDQCVDTLMDKYVLDHVDEKWRTTRKIVFMPGHNRMDVASVENISRILFEHDDVMVKPHPLTNDNGMNTLGRSLGWNRIIPREVSGMALLQQCDVVYTTSASEMAITGTLLGKSVVNVSNFFYEGSGTYHPISRLLFNAHREHGADEARRILGTIINHPASGLIMPWHNDQEVRLEQFFQLSLDLREQLKPIAAPLAPVRTRGPNDEKTQ